jgi:hypothetical protein
MSVFSPFFHYSTDRLARFVCASGARKRQETGNAEPKIDLTLGEIEKTGSLRCAPASALHLIWKGSVMSDKRPLSRRVFLARAAGVTLTLGIGSLWRPLFGQAARPPYAGGVWLAGDHHIHTHYSPDGMYSIAEQVDNARRHGLGWCVITDHGGPKHDKIALEQAYPNLLEARRRFPDMHIFQGLEWNIPAAEHGSIILPPTERESKLIAEFEALYDERNESRPDTPANTEEDAVAALKHLQTLEPKPLFFANHPSRRGLDSPHELRAWAEAGPNVTRGFEGTPGHQAATFTGGERGYYGTKPTKNAWPEYPAGSYHTWGGYDWFVAKVGGVWDSLLGEGRPWYITSNSDSHKHWNDRTVADASTYATLGYVTRTDKLLAQNTYGDFYPGEYNKTWVYAPQPTPMAVLDAMRAGNMFTVLGDLIDRLELYVTGRNAVAPMGSALQLTRPGEEVTLTVKVRVPTHPNFGGNVPKLHHIDLIAGDITGPSRDRDATTNPSTRVVRQVQLAEMRQNRNWYAFEYRFSNVRQSFYVRLRGTNTSVDAPRMDTKSVNPWNDLWFYSNPVMVHLPGR